MDLTLTTPFRTARAYRVHKYNLLVELEHEGVIGRGEIAPVETYAQTVESAIRTLQDAAGWMSARDPLEFEATIDELLRRYPDQWATVAGIDVALHDWIGKQSNLPVHRRLGLSRPSPCPTSFTIGIDELDRLAVKVRAADEYRFLKIKLGTPDDRRILEIIREAAPDKSLRVDANEAWSVDQSFEMLPILADFGVELLEQPLPRGDLEGLRRLRERRILPIIADESCIRPADLPRLAACVDGVNIKISKCGGIRQSLGMAREAMALGLRVMLGCMIESSLGISAALQLASLADWLDLDGCLLVRHDPFSGLRVQDGCWSVGESRGLGVAPRGS